jgi:hypothetical protein
MTVRMSRLAIAAATVLAFAASFAAGPLAAAEPDPATPRFLLLIGSDAEAAAAQTAALRDAVVAEYVAWARSLRDGGHLVAADELAPRGTLLTADDRTGTARQASAGGYFLVTAASLEEAVALSRDCPALRRGGSVEVVPVVEH